jgi:ribosomal protein S18 acetylase RimI-like enzyme
MRPAGGAFVMGTVRPVESGNVESSNDVSRDDAQSPQRTDPAEAGIAIRPATEHDHRGLARLLDATDDFHASALPALFRRPLPSERPPEAVVAGLRRSGAAVLVAVAGTELVGLVQVSTRDAPQLVAYQPRRYAFVEELVVLAPWRRRGVGQALMEAAHRWALEQGLREVELNVFAFNTAALGLYDRLGYRPQSLRLVRRLP